MKKTIILMMLLFGLTSSMASANEQVIKKPDTLFSKSAVIIDSGTGSVLYSKNAHKKMNPASITKIATAIYALEHGNLEDIATVSDNAANIEGSTVYLLPGEKISLEQLMRGMMVNSGNDAAVAIAEHTEGSVHSFMKKLNGFLEDEVGVKNTHFENPHGLYGENHYTTAYDMAKITSYALKNNDFQMLFGIDSFDWSSEGWDTTLYNHHKLVKGELPYPEVTGGKNGFISEANHTLVTSAENEGLSVVAVTLNAQSKRAIYADTISLLDYGLNQFTHSYIAKDSGFQTDHSFYELKADFHYTKPINEAVNEVVDEKGMLTIYNEDNQKIASTKLHSVRSAEQSEQEVLAASSEKESERTDSELFYPVFLYLIILVMIGIRMIRKREQNDSLEKRL
ncbi:D-alanyl-D-alanine carboxypeptidase family protein [Rossellomorea oryzaecorticis]|uniref:D-alanyl-D-alanine carboxypeptidase family protein n=1 Tax=Rossellomorea oryzaecorticis TaxID=1396505 RepID=A0ABU9K7B6_9BACI